MRMLPIKLEDLQSIVRALPWSPDEEQRDVHWITASSSLGLSRNSIGQIELFLVGEELIPTLSVLRRVLIHQQWHVRMGRTFEANRLVFPSSVELESLVALCCLELLKAGAEHDIAAAFSSRELLLSVSVEQMTVASNEVLGLLGELLVLGEFLRGSSPSDFNELVESWMGYQSSVRDFSFRTTGVEVKTTTQATSRHYLHGISQFTARLDESSYWLISVGLAATTSDDDAAVSVSSAVQSLVDQLQSGLGPESVVSIERLLAHVEDYGAATSSGYRHETMSQLPFYNTRLRVSFIRAYDMSDRRLGLPLSEWFASAPWVDLGTLSVSVALPRLSSPQNPLEGPDAVIRTIIHASE